MKFKLSVRSNYGGLTRFDSVVIYFLAFLFIGYAMFEGKKKYSFVSLAYCYG